MVTNIQRGHKMKNIYNQSHAEEILNRIEAEIQNHNGVKWMLPKYWHIVHPSKTLQWEMLFLREAG